MRSPKILLCVLQVILFLALALSTIQAQTTQFSYQGSLNDGANPANGNYDFEFLLFGALSGGTQLGPTNTRNNVMVTNGVFSVYLDFGNQFSAGDNRWLEIRIRLAGQPGFTILAPRQGLATVPYAVKSLSADTATTATSATNATNASQLGGVTANEYVLTVDERLSDARNPLPNSSAYIQNQIGDPQPATFSISGRGKALYFDAGSYYINSDPVFRTPTGGNIFVGRTAGSSHTTGNTNSFLGDSAGAQNSTGSSNSFFGYTAGWFNSSGSSNAFFGVRAGFSNNGSANSFFGNRAGESNTSASNNAFFGNLAGKTNNTGYSNSFFGHEAGEFNTVGRDNAFFGTYAGQQNTNGANNAFLGVAAGQTNTTGAQNTFLGAFAGQANTIGNYNTAIGFAADVAFNNLFNATAIGQQAYVSTSNSLVLGSISGVNGATANTNVGIGIQAPIARFQVRGPVLFSNDVVLADPNRAHLNVVSTSGNANLYLQGAGTIKGINFGVSGSAPNATLYIAHFDGVTYQDRLVVNQDGNVGIGNAAPSAAAKLQVNGAVRVTNGGIFIANPNTLVITSPNGACWGITVNNSGVLSTFSTPCP